MQCVKHECISQWVKWSWQRPLYTSPSWHLSLNSQPSTTNLACTQSPGYWEMGQPMQRPVTTANKQISSSSNESERRKKKSRLKSLRSRKMIIKVIWNAPNLAEYKVCACVRACVRACVLACVHACMRACVHLHCICTAFVIWRLSCHLVYNCVNSITL